MAKAQAAEPSMEEILASIRRIISDEVQPAPQAAAPVLTKPAAAPAEQAISEDDLDKLFADEPADDEMALELGDSDDVLDLEDMADEAPLELQSDDGDLELVEPMADSSDLDFVDPAPADDRAEVSFDDFEPTPAPVAPPKPEYRAPPVEEPRAVAPSVPPKPVVRPSMNFHAATPTPASPLMSQDTGTHVSAAFSALTNTILSNNARTLEDLVVDMLKPMLKDWLDDNLPTMVENLVKAEIERVSRGGR